MDAHFGDIETPKRSRQASEDFRYGGDRSTRCRPRGSSASARMAQVRAVRMHSTAEPFDVRWPHVDLGGNIVKSLFAEDVIQSLCQDLSRARSLHPGVLA